MMIPLQAVVHVVIKVQYTRATVAGVQLFTRQPVHFQVMIELRKVGLDRRNSVVIFVLGLTVEKVAAVLYTNMLTLEQPSASIDANAKCYDSSEKYPLQHNFQKI